MRSVSYRAALGFLSRTRVRLYVRDRRRLSACVYRGVPAALDAFKIAKEVVEQVEAEKKTACPIVNCWPRFFESWAARTREKTARLEVIDSSVHVLGKRSLSGSTA